MKKLCLFLNYVDGKRVLNISVLLRIAQGSVEGFIFSSVLPEQVNSENSNGEKEVDCIEEECDDHSCCT